MAGTDDTLVAFAPVQLVCRVPVAFARERIQPLLRDPDTMLAFGPLIAIAPRSDPRIAAADKEQK